MKCFLFCLLPFVFYFAASAQTLPVLNKPKPTVAKPKAPAAKASKYTPKKSVRDATVYDTSIAIENSETGFSFFDDFTNNNNKWYVDTSIIIRDGKCIIKNYTNSSYFTIQNFLIDIKKDFTCSVICKWNQGALDKILGIDYCSEYQKSYYNFSISPNEYYIVGKIDNNGWKDLIPWTFSSEIYKNDMPNVLKIIKSGDYIQFYINENLVKSLPYEDGFGSWFGLRAGGVQTVSFDNFRLEGTRK